MPLNPFVMIAKAFYVPFKAAILATWNAAKTDAFAEIRAGVPTDVDFAEVATALAEMRDAPDAIEDEPKRRRKK